METLRPRRALSPFNSDSLATLAKRSLVVLEHFSHSSGSSNMNYEARKDIALTRFPFFR